MGKAAPSRSDAEGQRQSGDRGVDQVRQSHATGPTDTRMDLLGEHGTSSHGQPLRSGTVRCISDPRAGARNWLPKWLPVTDRLIFLLSTWLLSTSLSVSALRDPFVAYPICANVLQSTLSNKAKASASTAMVNADTKTVSTHVNGVDKRNQAGIESCSRAFFLGSRCHFLV